MFSLLLPSFVCRRSRRGASLSRGDAQVLSSKQATYLAVEQVAESVGFSRANFANTRLSDRLPFLFPRV